MTIGMLDMVWDATRSKLFASAASKVVIIDTDAAKIVDTIATDGTADRIAVSDDGKYLYAAISSESVVRRYLISNHQLDIEIQLPPAGANQLLSIGTMIALPGQPRSILLARAAPIAGTGIQQALYLYDDAVLRGNPLATDIIALYVYPADHSLRAYGPGSFYRLQTDLTGPSVTKTTPVALQFGQEGAPVFNGNLAVGRGGSVFNLDTDSLLGKIPESCALGAAASGKTVYGIQQASTSGPPQYSGLIGHDPSKLLPIANAIVHDYDFGSVCLSNFRIVMWGENNFALRPFQAYYGGDLMLLRADGLQSLGAGAPAPEPSTDATGVIHLPLAANGMIYDPVRNLLWASVPGTGGALADRVVSIDLSGHIGTAIYAGNEPGQMAISSDGRRMFVASGGTPRVNTVDLEEKQLVDSFSVLGDTGYWTPTFVTAIPNQNESVAVTRNSDRASYELNLTVYDNGVARPTSFSSIPEATGFGDPTALYDRLYPAGSADTFYGVNTATHYGGGAVGSNPVALFQLREDGLVKAKTLTPLALPGLSLGPYLVYDGGRLFTCFGEMWSPDVQTLEGTFAFGQTYSSYGFVVPFADQGKIVYLSWDAANLQGAITTYDLNTTTLATMPVPFAVPTFAFAVTAIRAGSAAIAISTGTEILIVPLSAMSPPPSPSLTPTTVSAGIQRMDIQVNDIDVVPGTSKLLLAVPGSQGKYGNALVTFDASTNKVAGSVFAGSEPMRVAVAQDGSDAYVYLPGELHIARVALASQTRARIFAADPDGGTQQYPIYDMKTAGDGGLAVSYYGGWIAVFDDGKVRSVVDKNATGSFAGTGGTYSLTFAGSGSLLYGAQTTWSTSELQRYQVDREGVHWLSGIGPMANAANALWGDGLLYSPTGLVTDGERSRLVGQFGFEAQAVCLDLASHRVYLAAAGMLEVFDSDTYALVGQLPLSNGSVSLSLTRMVKYGSDGLALLDSTGAVYLVSISAIAQVNPPVPSQQPPGPPKTDGVTVVELAANDLAYDPARKVLYATIPNSEAGLGDKITEIDPATGKTGSSFPAGLEPRLIALSSDNNRLFYTQGALGVYVLGGFSTTSESVRSFDFASKTSSPDYAAFPAGQNFSYSIVDIAPIPHQSNSVVVLNNLFTWQTIDGTGTRFGSGPQSVRVYDNGVPRHDILSASDYLDCFWIAAGSTSNTSWCLSPYDLLPLTLDATGVHSGDKLYIDNLNPPSPQFVFNAGWLYTADGKVFDTVARKPVGSVDAKGLVTVDGNVAWWLDAGLGPLGPTVKLSWFDAITLKALGTKQINVVPDGPVDYTRPVPCGTGRIAFRAGREIYIVQIPANELPKATAN